MDPRIRGHAGKNQLLQDQHAWNFLTPSARDPRPRRGRSGAGARGVAAAAGHHHRAVRGGRIGGLARTHPAAAPAGEIRHTVRGREQIRRRRQYRHRLCGEGACRRLHAARGHGQLDRDQLFPLHQAQFRRRTRHPARIAAGAVSKSSVRQSEGTGEIGAGADRLHQSQQRKGQLRLVRDRHVVASFLGHVRAGDQYTDDPRSVPQHR